MEPRESARVVVPYHWNPGRDLDVDLVLSDGTTIGHEPDARFEALELADRIPVAYEGELLVVLGVVGALLLVQSIGAWREGRAGAGDGRATGVLWVAYLVAVGIGLHNLAEGLAIGSSFALGRVSLGAFLVIGFMLHTVTDGPAIVAPVARDERPAVWHFAALGLLAGAPVILEYATDLLVVLYSNN